MRNVVLSGDNFRTVWDGLMEFYDNRRALVNVTVSMLLDAKPMIKGSAAALEDLYSDVTQSLTMLDALKRSVVSWDDFLVNLIQMKRDRETFLEWEKSLGSSFEPPTWEELRKFLLSRIRMFQSLQGNSAANVDSNTGTGIYQNSYVRVIIIFQIAPTTLDSQYTREWRNKMFKTVFQLSWSTHEGPMPIRSDLSTMFRKASYVDSYSEIET